MTDQNALEILRERDRQWKDHARSLPQVVKTELTRVEARPPARVQLSAAQQARMDEILLAEREQKHVEQWRANLKAYAPIEEWEDAWNAKSMPDHNPEVEDPNFYAGTQGVLNWIANGCQKHMVLIGAIGCGKSIAAAVAVRHWVNPTHFQPVCWMTADELVSAVFHKYDTNAPKLCRYNVIDDVGDERKEDFEEALRKLLEMQDRKVVITSNLALKHKDPKKTWSGRYPRGRLTSMMRAKCTAIVIPGGSRRNETGEF